MGNTPIIKAAENGNIEIIVYLMNKGADLDLQNDQGMTAAMKAVEKIVIIF